MTTLRLSSESPAGLPVDTLVVGLVKGADGPSLAPGAEAVDEAFGGRLLDALTAVGAAGGEGEVTRVPSSGAVSAPVVLAVGLGKPAQEGGHPHETLRRAAGSAARALAGKRSAATTLALADGEGQTLRAVAEGSLLGAYAFRSYKQSSLPAAKEPLGELVVLVGSDDDSAAAATVERAAVVAAAVHRARDWVNTPPRDLPPAVLAQAAADLCVPLGLEVTVLDDEQLREGGYGGLIGVGQGSTRPPRLVRIAYRHPGASKHVALVGKGITFDSGGLSLKPAASMESMKSDMAGAAAVIATLSAVAALQPEVNVTGWAPLAENMPSGTAIRPSDVLTIYGGKQVEVLNTDAEGRLVLADAIVRACEENPDYLVDVATLTGAQLVALGTRTTGVMGHDAFRDRVVTAAGRAGETMWPMPMPQELRKGIDSDVADIKNTGPRDGGMLTAATFLHEFVADPVAWAHLDIAGPAFNLGEVHGYTGKGGTGVAVRTFLELLDDVAQAG